MTRLPEADRETRRGAVEIWYDTHGVRLNLVSLQQIGHGEFVRDAVQEIWLSLLRTNPPAAVAADPQRLFAWLVAAVRNRAVDIHRRERRHKHHELVESEVQTNDTHAKAERRESVARVRGVLAVLAADSESELRLLELRYFDERSVAEIADLLSVSPRVVSARLQRAKRKFRNAWAVRGGVVPSESVEHFVEIVASHFRVSHDSSSEVSATQRSTNMKKRIIRTIALCGAICCLMGADSITWNAGQPVANPGGKANLLEGAGTYAVDPNNTFATLVFSRQVAGTMIVNSAIANTKGGNWDSTPTVAAGAYDTWGEITTVNKNKNILITKTSTVGVNVK